MMLYWSLCLSNNKADAEGLLKDRWSQIDPFTWQTRLARGDVKVWREMLIGYYAGRVPRGEIFQMLED